MSEPFKVDTTEAEDDYRDYRHELTALRTRLEEVTRERDEAIVAWAFEASKAATIEHPTFPDLEPITIGEAAQNGPCDFIFPDLEPTTIEIVRPIWDAHRSNYTQKEDGRER